MFKTTDKVSRAIDQVRKVAEELKNEERKQQAISCVHQLTTLYADCISDMQVDSTKETPPIE